MTKTELNLTEEILFDLYEHFEKNPNSLLARIYGVFSVKLKKFDEVHLIVMGNTLNF